MHSFDDFIFLIHDLSLDFSKSNTTGTINGAGTAYPSAVQFRF